MIGKGNSGTSSTVPHPSIGSQISSLYVDHELGLIVGEPAYLPHPTDMLSFRRV